MKKLTIILTLMACLAFAGCAAKRANTTNPQPITQWEQVNYDNTQISIHNRALAKSFVAIRQAGFLEKPYFDKLSAAQIRITKLHKDLTPLLQNQANVIGGGRDKVKAILDELRTVTAQMVADGSVGISNPDSKSAVLSDIEAIISSVNSIYTVIEAVNSGK
jgi:hypothetical protein